MRDVTRKNITFLEFKGLCGVHSLKQGALLFVALKQIAIPKCGKWASELRRAARPSDPRLSLSNRNTRKRLKRGDSNAPGGGNGECTG